MHVIGSLDHGGAEAMLVRLLGALDPAEFSQSVVSLTTRGVYGDAIEAAGVPLLTLGITGVGRAPLSVSQLARAIRVQQPGIVQTWLYHADLLGLLAARAAGDAAVAWNVRCSWLRAGDAPLSTRLLSRLLARMARRPEAVVFNSIAGLEAHRALGYRPRRVEVIPNGFDLAARRPDDKLRREFRHEIGVDDSTFVVGMIARFHRLKDQSTFLAAAGRLKGMGRPVRFVLVGLNHAWSNAALAADIDQYGLRGYVSLLGIRDDVSRIMAGLDCLVSTSTSEGFPNVIGEAMACGVPCVATDAGDSRFIIGDTGAIVPVGDVAGVVEGVSALMAMPPAERRSLGERCRRRIVERFELTDVAWRYAELYRELDARRSGAAAGAPALQADARLPARIALAQSADSTDGDVAGTADNWHERFVELSQQIETRRSTRRRRLVQRVSALVLAYLVVFHTPLVWLAGEQLTIRQPPRRADAIVVFSGNGEASYINDGYQRRARDAARYFRAGFAPMVVISSGIQQTFAEVEIIRALLLSQGVPDEAMHIVPEYPASTHENVQIVYDVLKDRGLTSILFITAPYHSRRATLIWRRLAPEVEIVTVPVIDTPPSEPDWSADLDQIRAILYEYAAIAYNRSRGWL